MPTAICSECKALIHFRNTRGARLADLACRCGGKLKAANRSGMTVRSKNLYRREFGLMWFGNVESASQVKRVPTKVRNEDFNRWLEFTRLWFGESRYAISTGAGFSRWEVPSLEGEFTRHGRTVFAY